MALRPPEAPFFCGDGPEIVIRSGVGGRGGEAGAVATWQAGAHKRGYKRPGRPEA